MGVLTREQEIAMFARDRNDLRKISSEKHLSHMREGSVPKTNPHAVKRFHDFFTSRKIQAIETQNTKSAIKNQAKAEKERDAKKLADEEKIISAQIDLRRKLQSKQITRSEYDEKIAQLRKDNKGAYISSSPVLPKDQNKKNIEQAKRDFEKIRSPNPIFPSGSGYQRYDPKTEQFTSKLTYEEQKALGVERPTMTVPIKEGHNEFYNIEIPVIPRSEMVKEMGVKQADATEKAIEQVKKTEEKQGFVDVDKMTPDQRLALLAIKPEAFRSG